MTRIAIDTHAWVWFTRDSSRLPTATRTLIETAESVTVPSVCIYEIGQKVRLNRWPGMDRSGLDLLIADASGRFDLHPLDTEIARRASLMDWAHRDPFDRVIAATALALDAPLVSIDRVFDDCPGLRRLWEA